MKARMKKIQLILHHKEKELFLRSLQDLGLLHLEINELKTHPNIDPLKDKRERIQKALNIVGKSRDVENQVRASDDKEAYTIADQILEISTASEQLSSQIESLEKQIKTMLPWGDFDYELIKRLEAKGIHIRFFMAPAKAFYTFNFAEIPVALISVEKGLAYFVVIGSDIPELPFDKASLSEKSLSALQNEVNQLNQDREKSIASLSQFLGYVPVLELELKKLDDEINYYLASVSFKETKGTVIHHVTGWVPETGLHDIEQFLDRHKIAHILSDPGKIDDVPIILKNKKYPKIFESITKIFELPHYRELDLTPVIAVFYPIFFAYCLGDSGYGLIFLILFGVGYFTFLKQSRVIAVLGMILGLSTMVIGIIKSGTILGIPITQQRDMAFFDFFSRFVIIPETGDTPFNAFNVALILGLIQIIVGVVAAIIRAWIYESFAASLSSFGKLFIIISVVTLFLGSAQEVEIFLPFQALAKYGLIAGIAMVLLFNNINLPILERISGGILPLYFIFTGLLGDTLSYIRLFALGISSGILGLVINSIGNQIMSSGFVGIIIGIIFLILGHGLNLFIASLGSFVHPLRLTFVEFYNNAGFKGGGVPFKPFKKESLNSR
jgi:V/A-type H+-transporting ATPase subunit I